MHFFIFNFYVFYCFIESFYKYTHFFITFLIYIYIKVMKVILNQLITIDARMCKALITKIKKINI